MSGSRVSGLELDAWRSWERRGWGWGRLSWLRARSERVAVRVGGPGTIVRWALGGWSWRTGAAGSRSCTRRCAPRPTRSGGTRAGGPAGMSCSAPTRKARCRPATRCGRLACRAELPAPLAATVDVWWLEQYAGGLFLPLRDGSAGVTSYGGGRDLLDTAKGADLGGGAGTLVVDLNFLYHPSCRYDPVWQCPLAPPGNTITAPVHAGERL